MPPLQEQQLRPEVHHASGGARPGPGTDAVDATQRLDVRGLQRIATLVVLCATGEQETGVQTREAHPEDTMLGQQGAHQQRGVVRDAAPIGVEGPDDGDGP
jgi:hypothetical protein